MQKLNISFQQRQNPRTRLCLTHSFLYWEVQTAFSEVSLFPLLHYRSANSSKVPLVNIVDRCRLTPYLSTVYRKWASSQIFISCFHPCYIILSCLYYTLPSRVLSSPIDTFFPYSVGSYTNPKSDTSLSCAASFISIFLLPHFRVSICTCGEHRSHVYRIRKVFFVKAIFLRQGRTAGVGANAALLVVQDHRGLLVRGQLVVVSCSR